jgi:predicted ATP-grasp superfamily ATP-dependent carboligase
MYTTNLEAMIAGATPPDPQDLEGYRNLARDIQPLRFQCIHKEESAFTGERLLAETKGEVTRLLLELTSELQQKRVKNWDEVISNPASDTRALSEQLRPLEDHSLFIGDVKDHLEIRINEARVTRLTATLERAKTDKFEAELLCAISILTVEAALAPVREAIGPMLAFSVQTQQLQAAAAEKKRLLALAESALRDEVTRQLTAEQTRMASGTITRAQIASSIG